MNEENQDNAGFLGNGWSFPPVFDRLNSSIELRKGNNDIRESLEILLSTVPGERLLDPEFGCDLSELIFENLTVSIKKRLSDRIRRAIVSFEPRISYEDAEFKSNLIEGYVNIKVTYLIRSTNSRSNMVFPYYLTEGTNL